MNPKESTKEIKAFIHKLGIDLYGIADLSKLTSIPAGLDIDLEKFFLKYPYAIVLGAQYGKVGKHASGTGAAIYLETIAYEIMEFLEERNSQYLVIHPEDEYDPDNRMGFLSLKVLAKQAGLGWQGRSLLIVSPEYGPVHRLIAILTNINCVADEPMKNRCFECRICVDSCPQKSLTACRFDDHPDSRAEVLDLSTCKGDHGCMVCILKCPYLTGYT